MKYLALSPVVCHRLVEKLEPSHVCMLILLHYVLQNGIS